MRPWRHDGTAAKPKSGNARVRWTSVGVVEGVACDADQKRPWRRDGTAAKPELGTPPLSGFDQRRPKARAGRSSASSRARQRPSGAEEPVGVVAESGWIELVLHGIRPGGGGVLRLVKAGVPAYHEIALTARTTLSAPVAVARWPGRPQQRFQLVDDLKHGRRRSLPTSISSWPTSFRRSAVHPLRPSRTSLRPGDAGTLVGRAFERARPGGAFGVNRLRTVIAVP
jgi:hypothetical protein